MADNIFNNRKKASETKKEISSYFKTDDRPIMDRLGSLFGDSEDRKRKLAEGMARKSSEARDK